MHRYENSENTLKNAFSLQSSIAPRGFEPIGEKTQVNTNQQLINNVDSVFAASLAKSIQNCPELKKIIEAWPKIPEHIKATIITLTDINLS